jgi:hypothetical protein
MGKWMYRSMFSSPRHSLEVSGQLYGSGRYIPRERVLGTHLVGGWVGPRGGLDATKFYFGFWFKIVKLGQHVDTSYGSIQKCSDFCNNVSAPDDRQVDWNISKSKSHYDRQSVGQSVLVSGAHLGPATNFTFSLKFSSDSCVFVIL